MKKSLAVVVAVAVSATIVGTMYSDTKAIEKGLELQKVIYSDDDCMIVPTVTPSDIVNTPISLAERMLFMRSYFSSLNVNMGVNYKGSCGYVALGMILSYYDTFLNDSIIAEQYDAVSSGDGYDMIARNNSPGIYQDIFSETDKSNFGDRDVGDLEASEYFSWLSSQKEYSLHAKLITIGEAMGYYDYGDKENPCGTTINGRITIVQGYLNDRGFKGAYSFKNKIRSVLNWPVSNEDVKNFVKENIDAGYPVLVSLRNTKTDENHACVAYSYDDNDIYVNMGWGKGYEHVAVSSRFDRFKDAMVLDFNIGHTHSNNYEVYKRNIDGTYSSKYYCYDDSAISTSIHKHNYYKYEVHDSSYHKSYCSCGDYVLEQHDYGVSPATAVYSIGCRKCGYSNLGGGGAVTASEIKKLIER